MLTGIPFFTARWANLIVVNYVVPPHLLEAFVPRGTQLDFYEGKTFVSLVAFQFQKNRLFGLIPSFPSYSFEEINLRFYLRTKKNAEERRGVAFIREFVPAQVIAWAARTIYEEPYDVVEMYHDSSNMSLTAGGRISYGLRIDGQDLRISARTKGPLKELDSGSLEEFILEHYWGYTARLNGTTSEYRVRHPRWKLWDIDDLEVSDDFKSVYGEAFNPVLSAKPHSAFVVQGSEVSMHVSRRFDSMDPLGWVLYDGACGFCTWWIPFWKKTIQRAGYDIAPLQAKWVRDRLKLEETDLSSDIRLLLSDDSLINGADAYIYGMRRVWWSSPVGFVLGLPGFRALTWKFYKVFNRNRFLVSRICKLAPKLPEDSKFVKQ